jgi:hypothetical protein
VRIAAGKVSKLVVGVSSLKLNLRKTRSLRKRQPLQGKGTGPLAPMCQLQMAVKLLLRGSSPLLGPSGR